MSLRTRPCTTCGRKLAVLAGLLGVILMGSCGYRMAPQEATIVLDPNKTYQTITGWEAVAQAGQMESGSFSAYSDFLFNSAVHELGINRLRLEIRSGIENPVDYFTLLRSGQISEQEFKNKRYEVVNDNADPNLIDVQGFQFAETDMTIETVVLPMRKLLAERGEKLYVNLNFVDFQGRGDSTIRHDSDPNEYAEFMLAAFQHMDGKYGFVPDAIEVVLEPDTDTGWTGTEIGHAVVATASLLKANGFSPSFIVPSTTSAANAPVYIEEIAAVPGALHHISEFSYHRYRGVTYKTLVKIRDLAALHGKNTSMLEWIGADHNTLHEDLKVANVSAWEQYTLAFPNEPDNGAQYYVTDKSLDPVIKPGRRTNFLRQYFRYVRPGARRISATTNNDSLDPVAFINSDGSYVVVVNAKAPGAVEIEGFRPDTYGVTYTTEAETGPLRVVEVGNGQKFTTTMPGPGVISIFTHSSIAK